MAIPNRKHWTVEEYLEFDRSSEGRHEYLNGEVFAMGGGSENHSLISVNVLRRLSAQLDDRDCFVYNSDFRINVSETGLYTYPDASIVCGEPDIRDKDTLLNPTVVIEVLSPSTERYDRGKKFGHYMKVATLQEYVLILQDTPRIERYYRQNDAEWLYTAVTEPDGLLELPSIDCTLVLTEVYHKVRFDDDNETRDA